ncbi:MAG: peptidylprolyl isomerase, partial [Candidatus Diapherotrites archaeon]|nr:peptidylprolyl isomerase [Candidatus Diapherotrites archaeon]
MSLSKGTIVKISYTGRIKASNQVFDTTDDKLAKENNIDRSEAFLGPVTVVVGEKQVLPGLDDALTGMKNGESKNIEISPAKGFGERDPKKLVMTPLKEFKARNINPYPGLIVEADNQK